MFHVARCASMFPGSKEWFRYAMTNQLVPTGVFVFFPHVSSQMIGHHDQEMGICHRHYVKAKNFAKPTSPSWVAEALHEFGGPWHVGSGHDRPWRVHGEKNIPHPAWQQTTRLVATTNFMTT